MHQQYSVSVKLLLIIPLISAQLIRSPSNGSRLLRFVDKLNVSGCQIFVHDTGKPDGPHLAVEPLMCVTESLHNGTVRYDSITYHFYVTLAVMLTDDTILAEVQRQLIHLSPKSVKFATVRDISVSTNTLSVIQGLGFDWTPDESVGFLRIGCGVCSSTLNNVSLGCRLRCLQILSKFGSMLITRKESELENLNTLLSAKIFSHGTFKTFPYRLTMQNQKTFDISMMTQRYLDLPICKDLQFVRSIQLNQCTARVHQRMGLNRKFLIEPLLCHNITNMRFESAMYDVTRDKYYLNLNVVLQDETTLNAVKSQLTDLSPVSVTFMRLWNAQSHVASALSGSFEIRGMMVSADWRSGQVRVYCKSEDDCNNLRREVSSKVFKFFKHIKWILTAQVDFECQIVLPEFKYIGDIPTGEFNSVFLKHLLAQFRLESDGKSRVTIQQRKTPGVSFQRNWTEYVEGFGDRTDFWIGLNSIHTLSFNGAKLRVEMKLWNETELHAEYDEFKVGDASTNYTMTYREMLRDKSNVGFDALEYHKGMHFYTKDRDSIRSCSRSKGEGGWWFDGCTHANPNGMLPSAETNNTLYVNWRSGDSELMYLKEIKLMLII